MKKLSLSIIIVQLLVIIGLAAYSLQQRAIAHQQAALVLELKTQAEEQRQIALAMQEKAKKELVRAQVAAQSDRANAENAQKQKIEAEKHSKIAQRAAEAAPGAGN